MTDTNFTRRQFLYRSAGSTLALSAAGGAAMAEQASGEKSEQSQKHGEGDQRLPLDKLRAWEKLGYGMFIHFGMSTFVEKELPDGKSPLATYAPSKLDVDQWISVARDAGMKYAVLTAKHVAGHCLWPSRYTAYTVANSKDTTDVFEKFVKACEKRGVLPGFYYCSWDNHNRFGSVTPSDPGVKWGAWPWSKYSFKNKNDFPQPPDSNKNLPPYTTSVYQGFMTAQVIELLTQYGPIAETWIDIPGLLGPGYRTFLYNKIAELQPETVIMMNNGITTGEVYDHYYAFPADLIAIERRLPPESGHQKWREIEGKRYYMPGEVCDPIGKEWFFVPGDKPRADEELLKQYQACRQRGVNFLLNVPPNKAGRIPEMYIKALGRLRKNAGI